MTTVLPSDSEVTAQDIIEAMLENLGVYSPGEAIPEPELTSNLRALNSMIEYYGTQGLILYARTTESFALTANDPTYTIGGGADGGADFATEWPTKVDAEASYIRDSSGNDYPLLPMTEREWSAVTDKSPTSGSIPTRLWYDSQFPEGEIHLDPAPQSGLTLYLVSEKTFNRFGSHTDAIEFPPGYQAFFEWNFTVWRSRAYRKAVDPTTSALAIETRQAIQNRNVKRVRKNLMIPVGGGNSGSATAFNQGE